MSTTNSEEKKISKSSRVVNRLDADLSIKINLNCNGKSGLRTTQVWESY